MAKFLLYLMGIVCERFWRQVLFLAVKNRYRRKQEQGKKKQEKKKADSSSIAAFLFRIDKEG